MLRKTFQNVIIKYLRKKGLAIVGSTNKYKWKTDLSSDYIRLSILEMISEEVRNVEGAVAEVGVYKGKFASHINRIFLDRRFYLFDTFEGFNKNDLDFEEGLDHKVGHLGDTSIEEVKKKLTYPKLCVYKKGYFPETTEGMEENFVFVSIDLDLYKPTLEALKYFYPRLTQPGFIFVHDYNQQRYIGTPKAVKQFSKENELTFLPIGDFGGSAVFLK